MTATTQETNLATKLASKIFAGDEVTAQNPALIGILIPLLQALAKALAENCNPGDAAGIRELMGGRMLGPWKRRWINMRAIEATDRDTYTALGGRNLAGHIADLIQDPENDADVDEILKVPVYGLLKVEI